MAQVLISPPMFSDTIAHIIDSRSKKQMCRIDARRIIAGMEYLQAFYDWSICDDPTVAMRSNGVHAKINRTVASAVYGPNPKPASISLDYTLPETQFDGRFPACTTAILATLRYLGRICLEYRAASFACERKILRHRETPSFSIKMSGMGSHVSMPLGILA